MPTEKPHLDSFHGFQCGELLQHTSGSDGKVLSRLGEVPGTSAVFKKQMGDAQQPSYCHGTIHNLPFPV